MKETADIMTEKELHKLRKQDLLQLLLAQGREAVKALLTDNVELGDEIEAKMREALQNVQD